MTWPTVCTPLRSEHLAVRGAAGGARVARTGRGRRSAAWARGRPAGAAVLVAGVAGALDERLAPGDLVVATEVRAGGAVIACPSAPLLAAALRRRGLPVHLGPLATAHRVVTGRARAHLAATGALAVDTESAALVARAGPVAVVRAVVDTPAHGLLTPGTAGRGLRALHALRGAAPALAEWAAATGPRVLVRATCGGVLRAAACDLVLVVGPAGGPSVHRLVEDAGRSGCPSRPVAGVADVDLRWLAGAARIGLLEAAAAAPGRADGVLHALTGLGSVVLPPARVPVGDVPSAPPREVT